MERTLITSALPYANGYLHLGHCAGAYLPADIYARFMRLNGEETIWVCGSDEHGVAITIAADKENVPPQKIIDKYHYANKEAFDKFGMSFDIYSRTSTPEHHETAKEFFRDMLDKGLLEEKEEEQFYDEQAKMFLPDRYVEGECPNCGTEGARGDQCDACGAYYNQTELKNPKSRVTGNKPIVKKTTHWYFKFGEMQDFLEKYISGHKSDWKENVLAQTRSWLKQGLSDRAVTRDLDWGVHIDDIEGIPEEKAKGKAIYVWFEAVLGYISITKRLMKEKGVPEDWKRWWQDDDTRYIAFIGKDNIVFHTLLFPAMLHAKGGYILPDNVPANEFLNLEGEKFSKSRGWSIDLKDYVNDFPEEHYIDALRYSLAMSFPETRDADFTWKDLQSRNNNELADILGNFVNRTIHFIHKRFDGKVPELPEKYKDLPQGWKNFADYISNETDPAVSKVLNENELALLRALVLGKQKISMNLKKYRFRDGITEMMNVARAANKYFNDEEPWKTAKSDPDECAKTMFICAQLLHSLAILFSPIIPFTSEKIFKLIGSEPKTGLPNHANPGPNFWDMAAYPALKEGTRIEKPRILFSKIEDDLVEQQVAKLGKKDEKAAKKEAPEVEQIEFDDFMKVKLRTAKIIKAEKIKKSKKLLKLQVDLGGETRQIIAGISQFYDPDDLVGKTVVVVANLKPAKLMGQKSEGMILAASTDDKLTIISPEDDEIGPGAEVR